MRIARFSGPKWSIYPKKIFFGTNHCYFFHLPIGPFHCAKLKKNLTADLVLWRCAIFGSKMVHLPHFFLENYYYHSLLPISPFHWAKFKKDSSSRSRVMKMCNFWAQNGPFPQMRIFSENQFMSLVSFIHAYLHAKNQSQVLIKVIS